jgi:hypothetical protein
VVYVAHAGGPPLVQKGHAGWSPPLVYKVGRVVTAGQDVDLPVVVHLELPVSRVMAQLLEKYILLQ